MSFKSVKVYVDDVGDLEPFWIVCPSCKIDIELCLVPPIMPEEKRRCDWCDKLYMLKVIP